VFSLPPNSIIYRATGDITRNGTTIQSGLPACIQGDVITCEFDTAAATVSFYKNGVQMGTTVTSVVLSAFTAYGATTQADVMTLNCGQNAFTHAVNTGADIPPMAKPHEIVDELNALRGPLLARRKPLFVHRENPEADHASLHLVLFLGPKRGSVEFHELFERDADLDAHEIADELIERARSFEAATKIKVFR
jgi:hypothetical protein